MTFNCAYHGAEHDDFEWRTVIRNGKLLNICREGLGLTSSSSKAGLPLDKKTTRLNHWKDIKSRVTTHEGEMLTGKAGQTYQQKWGKKLLGINPSVNWNAPQYQKELEKRK